MDPFKSLTLHNALLLEKLLLLLVQVLGESNDNGYLLNVEERN